MLALVIGALWVKQARPPGISLIRRRASWCGRAQWAYYGGGLAFAGLVLIVLSRRVLTNRTRFVPSIAAARPQDAQHELLYPSTFCSGKAAVVTGGNGGIGSGMARGLRRQPPLAAIVGRTGEIKPGRFEN